MAAAGSAELRAWARRHWRGPRLLVLDFDGTLSHIAPKPRLARILKGILPLLRRLRGRPGLGLAVMSGRDLWDLKRRFPLPGLILVGNHGLACNRPLLGIPASSLALWRTRAALLAERLAELEREVPGCFLELKGPDLSLHYRGVRPSLRAGLKRRASGLCRGLPVAVREGKMVLEIRPKRSPDKGSALMRLAALLAPGWNRRGACLYLGDDATDEDAFRRLKRFGNRAMGVKVGRGPTRARARLSGPVAVRGFLKWLAQRED